MKRFIATLIVAFITILVLYIGDRLETTNNNGWTQLFNGNDLTGWEILNGKAEIKVSNNEIIGKTVENTPNTFLCYKKDYRDFILEFEVNIEEDINSGVQIRSNTISEYRKGVVHGYQIEIDPSERAYSGGIFDEQRRGWLYDLSENKNGREAFKVNEWNKFHIEAIGDTIRTWVNGVHCSYFVDSISDSGFIGLQVHGVGGMTKPDKYVKFKNRLKHEIEKFYVEKSSIGLSNEYILEQVLRNVTSFKIGEDVFNKTYILPFGDNYTKEDFTVTIDTTEYILSSFADLDKIENSLLVYLNGKLLVVEKDYTITSFSPLTISLITSASGGDTLCTKLYNSEKFKIEFKL